MRAISDGDRLLSLDTVTTLADMYCLNNPCT